MLYTRRKSPVVVSCLLLEGFDCLRYSYSNLPCNPSSCTVLPSTLYRRHSRVRFCRQGAAFDIFVYKTFVGKLFPGDKPLCAVFTLDQGRRVYEGSGSVGSGEYTGNRFYMVGSRGNNRCVYVRGCIDDSR